MFQFEKDQDHVGRLTLDMPGRSTNVVNDAFIKEFKTTLDKIFSDSQLKGLVITSGKKDFMAGGDLEFIYSINSIEKALGAIQALHESFRFLETRGKPVVAAINGSALGGGLELALACHYRVCLKDSRIQLGLPEVTLGLLPGGGGTERLPRLIGIQPALEYLTLGNKTDPERAFKSGIIHELTDSSEKLFSAAKSWILKNPQTVQPWDDKKYKIPGGGVQSPTGYGVFAASNAMAAEKTFNNYPAPKAILSCVYEGLQVPFETGLKIESRYFAKMVTHPVAKNMIKTLFFGIQDCNKGAARPKDLLSMPVKKLAILGGGMMGSGIAYTSAKAGIPIVLKDISKESAERGKNYSVKLCDNLVEKGRMTVEEKNKLLTLIETSVDPGAVKDCDLIIETVLEDRKIKAQVTRESEAVAPPSVVMASNTSTLPITGLAEASKRPERFIGLHFFSPVDKMPLVEIILGKKTNQEALAKAIDYVQQIKKTPIVVNDGRGFYTSRVFTTYVNEGISLLKEGVDPVLIENGAKMAGMPVGPLSVADEVSIELMYHVMRQTITDLGPESVDKNCYEVTRHFVEDLKRLGRKSGAGFYEYPPQGKKFLWPKLRELFPLASQQPSPPDVQRRLLKVQAVESKRCLDEGILLSSRDGDVGSILGWGFPAYTGGTITYYENVISQERGN